MDPAETEDKGGLFHRNRGGRQPAGLLAAAICGYDSPMANPATIRDGVLRRGVYAGAEALRLINFRRNPQIPGRPVSRHTIARWLRGYDYKDRSGETRHSAPLWRPDYADDDGTIELSFRDLIELRFVKAFRDLGLGLPTIRACFKRAVDKVHDDRPFSTQRFHRRQDDFP